MGFWVVLCSLPSLAAQPRFILDSFSMRCGDTWVHGCSYYTNRCCTVWAHVLSWRGWLWCSSCAKHPFQSGCAQPPDGSHTLNSTHLYAKFCTARLCIFLKYSCYSWIWDLPSIGLAARQAGLKSCLIVWCLPLPSISR